MFSEYFKNKKRRRTKNVYETEFGKISLGEAIDNYGSDIDPGTAINRIKYRKMNIKDALTVPPGELWKFDKIKEGCRTISIENEEETFIPLLVTYNCEGCNNEVKLNNATLHLERAGLVYKCPFCANTLKEFRTAI